MEASEILYNKALRFLAFRPRSEKEVRDNLLKFESRGSRRKVEEVDETLINQVIERLKAQNFINDEEFAKWWIDSRLRFRPRSINLIKIELVRKGVNKDLIDAQISNFKFQISNELENAKKLIEKKIKRYKHFEKREIYQKLGRFLASKGFDYDTIKEVVDEVLKKGV